MSPWESDKRDRKRGREGGREGERQTDRDRERDRVRDRDRRYEKDEVKVLTPFLIFCRNVKQFLVVY